MLKGQITIEYLLLGVIGLSLIFIALISLKGINQSFISGYNVLQFKDDVVNLNTAMDDVCVLGKGNQRTVTVKEDIALQKNGDIIRYSEGRGNNAHSIPKKLICDIETKHINSGKNIVRWDSLLNRIIVEQK